MIIFPAKFFAFPTAFPTGATVFKPEKWGLNVYTIFPGRDGGTILIDIININGNVVKQWKDIFGFPNKLYPGGYLIGDISERENHQDDTVLIQVDWNGNATGIDLNSTVIISARPNVFRTETP